MRLQLFQDSVDLKLILATVTACLGTVFVFKNWLAKVFTFRKKEGLDLVHGFPFFKAIKEIQMLLHDKSKLLDRFGSNIIEQGDILKASMLVEDFVFLLKPEYIQALYCSKDVEYLDKCAVLYRVGFEFTRGNGLFTVAAESWHPHRKTLSRAFLYNYLNHYNSECFNKYGRQFVAKLEKMYDDATVGTQEHLLSCTLNRLVHLCGIQIICQVVTGDDNGIPAEDCNALYDAMQTIKDLTFERQIKPWLIIDQFWRMSAQAKEYQRAADVIDETVKNIIKRKQLNEIEKSDININGEGNDSCVGDAMIDLMQKSDMKENDIMANLKTFIMGGYETTSSTIHFLLFMLSLNQDHQEKCREEVDAVFRKPGNVVNGNLTYAAISELKHLERCALETLRLYPVFIMVGRKIRKPLKLDDRITLPEGTNAMLFIPSIHKNPRYYPDPEKFDPERFSTENVRARNYYTYLPFSAGTRNCIGKKFAMAEIKTVVAHFLRKFEIDTTDKIHDVATLPKMVLTPERDYNFILRKRNFIN